MVGCGGGGDEALEASPPHPHHTNAPTPAPSPTPHRTRKPKPPTPQNDHPGVMPDFLPETRAIRDDPAWRGAAPAPGLVDRRVEITGPVDRKMVINALNSGATQYMADFEGALLGLRG